MDIKNTLNLPKTSFSMKANLPQREPEMLRHWGSIDIFGRIRKARAGSPGYVLHDGPPYADVAIHMGHAVNKIIKRRALARKGTLLGLFYRSGKKRHLSCAMRAVRTGNQRDLRLKTNVNRQYQIFRIL